MDVPFLRNRQLCRYWTIPIHFMELWVTLPHLLYPSTDPRRDRDQWSPCISILSEINIKVSHHYASSFSIDLFPYGFSTNILLAFLFPLIHATSHSLLVLLFLIILIKLIEGHKLRSSSLCSPLKPPITWYHFISPWSKYSPQIPLLKHPQSPFLPLYQRPIFTPIQNELTN
jgi:hypothetical protein